MADRPHSPRGAPWRRQTLALGCSALLHAGLFAAAASRPADGATVLPSPKVVTLSIAPSTPPDPVVPMRPAPARATATPPATPVTEAKWSAGSRRPRTRSLSDGPSFFKEAEPVPGRFRDPQARPHRQPQEGPPLPAIVRSEIDGPRSGPPEKPLWNDVRIPPLRHRGDRDDRRGNSPATDLDQDAVRETPSAVRAELGIPQPGSGQGSFDFYSPFDFEKEMKKARKKVAADTMKHNLHKNRDRGYGVICNRGNGWFVCAKTLSACNERHNNLCRYAEEIEAKRLSRDILF